MRSIGENTGKTTLASGDGSADLTSRHLRRGRASKAGTDADRPKPAPRDVLLSDRRCSIRATQPSIVTAIRRARSIRLYKRYVKCSTTQPVGAGARGAAWRRTGGTQLAHAPAQRASTRRSVSLLAPTLDPALDPLHQRLGGSQQWTAA